MSNQQHILVVDDHARAREAVVEVLTCLGYQVTQCASGAEAVAALGEHEFDLVVTDLQMPGMGGIELIQHITSHWPATQVLMMTAHASIDTAVEAMRFGAFDYLEKPLDATRLEDAVKRALDRGLLVTDGETPNIIGSSPAMKLLREQIALIAATDETVLINGESGVGKELIASTIHALSNRAAGPMVSLNCPVLSEQLTESELFGHRRGAFTGADEDRVGRFEHARGGSILLDEITEIAPHLQAKLLRVLQERTFERVGDSEPQQLDARVLAATNRDLQQEVADGRFREDLFYRLAVLPINVPPLRERENDVIELAENFLSQADQRIGRHRTLAASTIDLMLSYPWPGNVRELQNIVTRACVLTPTDEIEADLIRPWLSQADIAGQQVEQSDVSLAEIKLSDLERRAILETLSRFDGHRQKTADALGIGVRTLSGKLRQYGVAPGEKKLVEAA